jgi:predicted Zn-dependent protease
MAGFSLLCSHLDETEADSVGLRFTAGAGYDPRAGAACWEEMIKAGEGKVRVKKSIPGGA